MKCGAQTESGRPCKNVVVPGTTRCYMHGGHSPMAKIKAEQTLALLRVPAIESIFHSLEALNKTVEQFMEDTCATCGYPRGNVEEKEALIKAARGAIQGAAAVLDRTGLGPRAVLEVRQSDGDLDLSLLTDEEKGRMIALLAQLRALKQEIRTRLHGVAYGVGNPVPQPAKIM